MAAKRKAINTYGCKVVGETQQFYDEWAFIHRKGIETGAPPRHELFRKIADDRLPKHFEWNEWTEKMIRALCDYSVVGVPGCSNSAKSYNIIGFAALWWLLAPEISSVTLISTSIKSLRRRGWAEVQRVYGTNEWTRMTGHMLDSQMQWQYKDQDDNLAGDSKHAIICKAVEEGSPFKVADDIKGVHTDRQMVIIDEATAVPHEAIWDACANLYSYPKEFILVAIGNPRNRYDKFGRFIEPKDGWTSVTVETQEWEGKPQPDIGNRVVQVIRFDAEHSPNIEEGKIVSRHLPTPDKVRAARNLSGGGNTPLYWTNFRGFPPPEGIAKTVFTESAIAKNNGTGKFKFTGRALTIIAFFDPAFGGSDKPVLRIAKMGEVEGGFMGIESFPPIIIPIDVFNKNPVHFQLAETLRRTCEKYSVDGIDYSVEPKNLGVDATGEGGGLCDIISRTWSPEIVRVEFGGKASEDSVNLEDNRKSREVYENKSVEIWFRTRDILNSGQLRGIDPATAGEMCQREFDDEGKRIKLQKKTDYKAAFGKSCDLSDSLVGISEVARLRGFKLAATGQTVKLLDNWDRMVERSHNVFADTDISQPDEIEDLCD